MKIFLTGFMGTGKTTYGTELAKICNMDFIDLDNFIEHNAKKSINQIFKEEGENKFRELEVEYFLKLIQKDNIVIATGGGTASNQNLINKMNETGLTIYLKLFPEQLFKRLKNQKKLRPLITDMKDNELKEFIKTKLKERTPYYQQSRIIIEPLKMTPDKLSKVMNIKNI